MSARLRRRYVRRARARVYPPWPGAWHHNDRMYGRQARKARRRNPPPSLLWPHGGGFIGVAERAVANAHDFDRAMQEIVAVVGTTMTREDIVRFADEINDPNRL